MADDKLADGDGPLVGPDDTQEIETEDENPAPPEEAEEKQDEEATEGHNDDDSDDDAGEDDGDQFEDGEGE